MKKKIFNDLKVGDEIYKVHLDFEHNKCNIETKTIKHKNVSLDASKENIIVFYFGIYSLFGEYCEVDKRLSIQRYFESYDASIESHKIPNDEYVYYATNKEDAEDIFKLKLIEHINSLNRQRDHIDEKIKILRKIYDNFSFT